MSKIRMVVVGILKQLAWLESNNTQVYVFDNIDTTETLIDKYSKR